MVQNPIKENNKTEIVNEIKETNMETFQMSGYIYLQCVYTVL